MSVAVLRATLVPLLLLNLGRCSEERLGPWFEAEPPARVRFAAAAGARVRCAARGTPPPALLWLRADGTPLQDEPGIRRIYSNGTLEVLPSSSPQTGAVTVRCRAASVHGVALSRDVTLEPVAAGEVTAHAVPAAAGGVAALLCRAAPPGERVLWYRGDALLDTRAPTPESRYVSAGEALLIRDVSAADAGEYSCAAPAARRSPPALLRVTTGAASAAPRPVAVAELEAAAGEPFCLPCVSTDHPPPHYTWYREREGRLQPVRPADELWPWAGGAALCARVAAAAHAGAWLCKAESALGAASAQLRVRVRGALAVTVSPTVARAAAGGAVRLACAASDARAALSWLHDGAAAGGGAELLLRGVSRATQGVYQCFARRDRDSAQATAELRLGESAPELVYTFIEQALRPGGAVSLRCAAAASPPPRLAWLLDGQPLDHHRARHRYSVSEETTPAGDVVSVLNISSAAPADGGRYTCRAHNERGSAEHSARLNIYGPPSIRALGPVRVVAGANATVYCPYAGYPISSVSWWRRGAGAAVGGAGRVAARGAALRLAPALAVDAGHYACAVAAPHGPAARRDIEIQVRNPPKISPFMFSSELTEGSSVQVLCGVSSGDKPMYFSWFKDGAPLPSDLQIEEKSLNEFSLLMFSDLSARHSGDYTCRVSNHAATVNYTATLSVKVAPAWVTEPLDAAVLLGAPLLLECAAKGYPTPIITWFRRIGEGSALIPESEQWEAMGGTWGSAGGAGDAAGAGGVRVRNGSLAAAAATRQHQGLYRCTADNGVGPPLLKHVNVTVHEPAHFEESGGNVSCVRGRSVSLSCVARGDAPLALHWTRRGARLDAHSYRWALAEERAGAALRSTLRLAAAERADAGEYRCHAHNHYGRSEMLIYLHVEEPPESPRDVRLGGVDARWVRVAWRAAGGGALYYPALCTALHSPPGAEPRHLTLNLTIDTETDHRLDDDGARTLSARLEGLRPASAYSLRLAAGNHVGQSPYSEPLTFTTLEEAPAASPQNVRVRPAGPGELHVAWSAPPQESWNGELLGYVATWREVAAAGSARAGRRAAPGWSSADLTLAGLRAATRHALAVRAYNRAGAGPASPLVYATTPDGVPEVSPSSVTCEGVTARSLRVRWTPLSTATSAVRGYDVHYAPIQLFPAWDGAAETQTTRAGLGGEASLQGLAAATNYSVWVRARADAGLGPPSPPVYCSTAEDAPGAVAAVRALAAGADAVRVTWLAPARRAGCITHYTLYTRELGKAGGEWSQRVEASEATDAGDEEVWREVRGLRPAVYEVWVRAATAAGPGPPSRPVTAAPAHVGSARISSFGRVIRAARGSRVRLRCAAVGAPPIRWRWTPLPPAHTVTDTGDLIVHKVEVQSGGNYTCTVRNAGGADAAVFTLAVVRAPDAPRAPRLARAAPHALHVAWDAPVDGGAPLLGYTVRWAREPAEAEAEGGAARVPAGDAALWLRRLACGAQYRVSVQAHNAVGASPVSPPLVTRTEGDKAVAAPGAEFVWANSTALRFNLLAWRARCGVRAWSVAVRGAGGAGGAWRELPADGESAAAAGLRPAAWYLVRVVARAPAGDTAALYRAPTRALTGESIGEAVEVTAEARSGGAADAAEGGAGAGAWRGGVAPALLAAGLAGLLAALAGAVAVRRGAICPQRDRSPPDAAGPHPQLYSTEPTKRNGKVLTPPDDSLEISPYATFSMSGDAAGALQLRTFSCGEPLALAAPPPRRSTPHHHTASEYGRGRSRDSDSESSGSPCAACAAELYRPPAAARAPLPARPRARARAARHPRRDTSPAGPTLRCGAPAAATRCGTPAAAAPARRDAL